ncbi:hypothetical protein [Robiginitalea marina]|uniref:Uncharacterized protein n=1 Tax=Robiginitalea marina TaxID=2954105 RepID=A0ABT1AYN8_9FLAO|nr:hypothetical protein [Robiginitalea marina]MCO5725021.1 hypothetical protein [Robiginitalea marina]
MKRLQYLLFILPFILVLGCNKDEDSLAGPPTAKFLFEDGFETQNNAMDELFPSDNTRWSTLQHTDPANATNEISVTNTEFSEGEDALRIVAFPSDSQLSKMDIEKNGLSIQSGDRVAIRADFLIRGREPLTNLLLIDLECCSCWDPNVGDNYGSENQCPGVRLMISGEKDYLTIERGKISGTTLQQTDLVFPRNQWVTVEWEMTLSDNETGQNRLTIDGVEVIDENAMNMPNPQVFRDVFAIEGIDFNLQQPTTYERVQVGATANPTAGRVEMFVDNFTIKVW